MNEREREREKKIESVQTYKEDTIEVGEGKRENQRERKRQYE